MILIAVSNLGLGLLKLDSKIIGLSCLRLHLGHLVDELLLFLLPPGGHFLKHLRSISFRIIGILLGCSIGNDLRFAASLLRRRLHEMAAGALGRGDLRGGLVDSRDLWVHVNVLVSIDGDSLVSFVDLLIYPVLEGLADDTVGNIADK